MPYDQNGKKIKNPTRGQRAQYNKQKSQARKLRKSSASNQGGASIGGGTSGGG